MRPHFECHVTVNLPQTEQIEDQLKATARSLGWTTSAIDGDPDLGDKVFFYFTKHGTDFDKLSAEMEYLKGQLVVPIIREKIEQIVWDKRYSI